MQKWKQLMIFPASLGHGRVGGLFRARGICQCEEAVWDPANCELAQCYTVSVPPQNCAGTRAHLVVKTTREMIVVNKKKKVCFFVFVCFNPPGKLLKYSISFLGGNIVTALSFLLFADLQVAFSSINWLRTKPKKKDFFFFFFGLWVNEQLDVFFVVLAPFVMSHFKLQRAICSCSVFEGYSVVLYSALTSGINHRGVCFICSMFMCVCGTRIYILMFI